MTVSTPVQPDFTTQNSAAYKAAIDGALAALWLLGTAFAPHEQSSPNMTVRLDGGVIWDGVTLTKVAAQSTGTITAPVSNPRIDLVVIDQATGAVSVVTGTEAASPVAPAPGTGKAPVAEVALATSTTAITNSLITDARVVPLPPVVGQAEAEAGTATTPRLWTAERVAQAIAANGDTTAIQTLRDQVAYLALLRAIDQGESLYGFIDGIADQFTDQTGIDGPVQIDRTEGTTIGNMTERGGIAAAFDGVTAQSYLASARSVSPQRYGWVGKQWSVARELRGFRAYGMNDLGGGFADAAGRTLTIRLKGSNSAPSAWGGTTTGFGGTTLHEGTLLSALNPPPYESYAVTTGTSYTYHWVEIFDAGALSSGEVYFAEIQFFEGGASIGQTYDAAGDYYASGASPMTLVSNAFTADAVPASARAIVMVDPQEAVTLNTDVIAEISRDDGTTWSAGVLAEVATSGTIEVLSTGAIDVSGQPSGTDMRIRVRTPTSKAVRVHGWAPQW